jgi:CAAX protease family protein
MLPVPFVIGANLAVGKQWGLAVTTMFGAFAVSLLALFGLADLAGLPLLVPTLGAQSKFALDAGLVVTAAAAAGFLIRPIRRDVAGFIPIDPDDPVHELALVFAVALLGLQVTSIAFTDVLASNNSQPPLTILDLFEDELPFLITGIVGVGIFIRRSPAESARRLGVVRPAWWQLPLALACAGVFFGASQASDALSHLWSPDLAHRVDATTQHVFGQLDNPFGIAAIALIPGICEEVMFRGALQPRLGLVLTALLFTSIHTEYGLSFDTLAIFVIAIGLGLIRKYTNTTTSSVCHVSYNLLVGIGIAASTLTAAVAVEAALIGISGYAVWTQLRRRAARTA